jgi:hypothetical protein
MSNVKDNTLEQLMLLRGMTQTTGALHDAQVLQLKYWPKLVAGDCALESRVDTFKKVVIYAFKTSLFKRLPKNFDVACHNLSKWTQVLLGSEWSVNVVVNEKQLYYFAPEIVKVNESEHPNGSPTPKSN